MSTTVSSGQTYQVFAGQTDTSDTVLGGGFEVVDSGGITIGTVVSSGGAQVVDSGGTTIGTVVSSGGVEFVDSGGVASGTIISSGGGEGIAPGGLASGSVVSSGGLVSLPITSAFGPYIGGTASVIDGVTIQAGALVSLEIYAGGSVSGFVVKSGDDEEVYAGGVAIETVVSSGGEEFVESGGVASGSVVSSGGEEFVESGGVASGSVVSSGGEEFVESGGVASGAMVGLRGYQYVDSGGMASGTVVNSGGWETVNSGGVAKGTVVSSGGGEGIAPGGIVSGGEVLSGGYINGLTLRSAAAPNLIDGVTLQPGAIVGLDVVAGGSISGFVVSNGGYDVVSAGGMTTGTIVNSGSTGEYVDSGGTASGTTVNGGLQELLSGTASGTIINSGGSQDIYDSGTASDTVVSSGGVEYVASDDTTTFGYGGTAIDTTVSSGGKEYIASGGIVSGGEVLSDGYINGLTLTSAAAPNLIDGVTLQPGAIVGLEVVAGGSISGFVVSNGGYDLVSAGGTTTGTIVSSGGSEQVSSGGVASGTMISGGGYELVSSGGTTTGTIVSSGGSEQVFSGGVASGTVISSGGIQVIGYAGIASSTLVSGGLLDLQAGAVVSGGIDFASGTSGTLQIGGTTMPTNVISGFAPGDTIDLSTVSYDNSGWATFFEDNDVVQFVESGITYTLKFDPMQPFSGGFELLPDAATGSDFKLSPNAVSAYSTSASPDPPLASPYDQVVRIRDVAPNGSVMEGTGFIVGSNTILTAAHVVETNIYGSGFASKIEVELGNTAGNPIYKVDSVKVDPLYLTTASPNQVRHDFAVIHVSNLPANAGFFDLEANYPGGKVNLTGYPGAGLQANDFGAVMSDIPLGTLDFGPSLSGSLASAEGDSGGPLWTYDGVTPAAVGIQSVGNGVSGMAVLLTKDVVSSIRSWAAALSSSPTTISSSTFVVSAGQAHFNLTVAQGGLLEILSGGAATGTVIGNGGTEFVFSGGTVSGTVISSGGSENVWSGGTDVSATIENGGSQTILSGGTASGTVLDGSAIQYVYGTASSTSVESGDTQIVESGGTTTETVIESGGKEIIASGGSARSTTVNNGGEEVISSGGTATKTTLNSGGSIDVTYLPYVAGGSATLNPATDVLTVSEGGRTYIQQLGGSYTGYSFALSNRTGGTDVKPTRPPAPSGLALAAGSDSGVKGDGITNVTKPTVTGKGVAGDTVTLRDGAKAIGTAVVAAAGTWSVTPAAALAAGVHSLTATETSATLGVSPASPALKLTIETSAPAPSGLSFAVAADKAAKGDTFTITGRGEAGDTVILRDGTTAIGSAKVAATGIWSLTTANPLAIGAHSLSVHEVDVAGNTSAASAAQSLTVKSAKPNAVTFVGASGVVDNFTGGAGNDIFEFSAASLVNSDIVKGGGGTNYLEMTTAGAVRAGGVSGVEVYELGNGAADSLTLTDANFAGVGGASILVRGGNAGNTINAAALTGADRVQLVGGAGKDVLTGGAGNDQFYFSAANLANSDIVKGGGGTNYLEMTTAGTVNAGGVSGVEVYQLGNGGADSLTLSNANFAGVGGHAITVVGGNAGNRLSEAGVAAADKAVLRGGAGADTLIAGQNATLTGGAGADVFWFTTPGSAKTPDTNIVTDFTHGSDKIALSSSGFGLGLTGPSPNPQALPADLFTANATGSFGNATERFAYDTATGGLYYDAHGNAAGSSRELVATLANHPAVSASDVFFVS